MSPYTTFVGMKEALLSLVAESTMQLPPLTDDAGRAFLLQHAGRTFGVFLEAYIRLLPDGARQRLRAGYESTDVNVMLQAWSEDGLMNDDAESLRIATAALESIREPVMTGVRTAYDQFVSTRTYA